MARAAGRLRARLSRHIQSRLPGAEGGIAAALATGDTGAIPEEDSEAMRRSGLAHLLSVSGLHLTAVVGATMFVALRLLALWPALALRAPLVLVAAGAGATAGIGYTVMTGAEVPTIRSCIAALLVLFGIALGRDAMTLRLVATGALIVLLLWPEALVGPSFQLSFAAITAIVALHDHPGVTRLFGPREESRWRGLLRQGAGLLVTGLVVEMALAPIALFHFHSDGALWRFRQHPRHPAHHLHHHAAGGGALLLDAAGLGAPLWWLAGQGLSLLLRLAHGVADMPGAVTMLPAMPHGAFGLMLAGGLWIALWRTELRRRWGIVPLLAGGIWAASAQAPDLLGHRRRPPSRAPPAGWRDRAVPRPRAGDYVRDTLGELSGTDVEAAAMDAIPGARRNADLCVAEVAAGGRRWRLLATRSPYPVEIAALVRACREADIVVSDRRLPRTCTPRWLKADRTLLARTGGLAIDLDRGVVRTVAEESGRHPQGRLRALVIAAQQPRQLTLHAHLLRPVALRIIGAVGRIEADHLPLPTEIFERRLIVVDQRDDDLALARGIGAADQRIIAIEDAGLDHGVAGYLKRTMLARPQQRRRHGQGGLALQRPDRRASPQSGHWSGTSITFSLAGIGGATGADGATFADAGLATGPPSRPACAPPPARARDWAGGG